nr:MAG TPA: hypothetical protein [Caudoviricetes sp.]
MREQMVEVLNEIEDGMCQVKIEQDIWQSKLIYALCQGVRLLLIRAIKKM